MKNETFLKIVGITVGVCFVAALFVTATAVLLKPRQDLNRKLEKIANIVQLAGFVSSPEESLRIFRQKISAAIVELETGKAIDPARYQKGFSPEDFDLKLVNSKKEFFRYLKSSEDLAGIKKLPRYMPIYSLYENGKLERVILLIYGKGLWSTLYGFLALQADLRTIAGITFFEHGETPGLGGEVDNLQWKKSWQGKKARSENGQVLLEVIKGKVVPSSAQALYQIDGLSGATLTTRGVNNLVRFWLSEKGYGKYLELAGAKNE